MSAIDLRTMIREVDDFPTPGVGFKDITPLLADPDSLKQTIGALSDWVESRQPDVIVGAEARGFILGAAVAAAAGCGFVPARRPGKLPPETVGASYFLEYGENALEVHPDLIPHGRARRDPRRRARDRRHRRGDLRPRRAPRSGGRGRVLHHRAHVPRRPGAARGPRRPRPHRLLTRPSKTPAKQLTAQVRPRPGV